MNRIVLVLIFLLGIVSAVVSLANHTVHGGTSDTTILSVHSVPCFQDTELQESIATLKQQGGAEIARVSEALLTKARTTDECRTQLVQTLLSSMAQATDPKGNEYANFFLWMHSASMLAALEATEALDLLIANIDFTDGWAAKLSESHFPALAAILKMGQPAIPKLQVALNNDTNPHKRQLAVLCIAYIGGSQARAALEGALPRETDPCLKRFLQVSLQAYNNKDTPNHISPALNDKWLVAFHCN
ncbi:MAG TPA: hypothetical protein VFS76_06715 [Pyrinomonadaceae bacterium]|nr:hypothetical protein [Pyrinomonadaceae bacterium]